MVKGSCGAVGHYFRMGARLSAHQTDYCRNWTATTSTINQTIGPQLRLLGSFCVVNIDDKKDPISGRVSVLEKSNLDDKPFYFWMWSLFTGVINNENEIAGNIDPPTVYSLSGELLSEEELSALQKQPDIEFPVTISYKGLKHGQYNLDVEWNSLYPSGSNRVDRVALEKKRPGKSSIPHQDMSWNEFKDFALAQEKGFIYRGQASNWRLQTSYHRTGQADLVSYFDEKTPELENHINVYSKHLYDSRADRSLGALLNLAQHHGYPTPLLDWTKSPYVAAFFAYENQENIRTEGKVSIFIFNEKEWSINAGRHAVIKSPNLNVRTMELPGYGNSRALPQQAISMYANVDDIETIIKHHENSSGEYIKAISIPVKFRETALKELDLMGITWGSLFPDIGGVCKQLKLRHFE